MEFVNFFCKVIEVLFPKWFGDKIKMTANIWLRDWRMEYPFGADFHREFSSVTDETIDQRFRELDERSISEIKKYIRTQRDYLISQDDRKRLFYNFESFLSREEIKYRDIAREKIHNARKLYFVNHIKNFGGSESLVFFHGLSLCTDAVKTYIKGGVFFDIGACFGDSTLVFAKYFSPAKVWSFEPSPKNRKIFSKIMQSNNISQDVYVLAPYGLGKENKKVSFHEAEGGCNSLQKTEKPDTVVECKRLDDFCKEENISEIKLIKADIEGMGMEMLLGAEETIRKNRPVLSLSIYHNQDELFGIYETLKKWNLNYHCIIRLLSADVGELSLIAWPKELDLQ